MSNEAESAGVRDLKSFAACQQVIGPDTAIERDIAAVKLPGGTGTPTVPVNDNLVGGPIDSARLENLIQEAIGKQDRRTPFP